MYTNLHTVNDTLRNFVMKYFQPVVTIKYRFLKSLMIYSKIEIRLEDLRFLVDT